jgi:hypothetical protein
VVARAVVVAQPGRGGEAEPGQFVAVAGPMPHTSSAGKARSTALTFVQRPLEVAAAPRRRAGPGRLTAAEAVATGVFDTPSLRENMGCGTHTRP